MSSSMSSISSMSKVNVSCGLLLKPRSARARVEWTRFLLEEEDASLIVYLGKLHRNQKGLQTEETDPHPDVFGFFVPVHEHFLRPPDLLPQRIVDRVTSAPLGCRRYCIVTLGLLVYCCIGHFWLLSRWPSGGVSSRAEAGGKSCPLRGLPTVRLPLERPGGRHPVQ